MDGRIHIVRTTHHDTGMIDLLCGETREGLDEPNPYDTPCGGCYMEAININRRDTNALATHVESNIQRTIGWVDDITLRLERAEEQLRKIERKGRKS